MQAVPYTRCSASFLTCLGFAVLFADFCPAKRYDRDAYTPHTYKEHRGSKHHRVVARLSWIHPEQQSRKLFWSVPGGINRNPQGKPLGPRKPTVPGGAVRALLGREGAQIERTALRPRHSRTGTLTAELANALYEYP